MGQFGKGAHVKWLGIMNLSCQRDASRVIAVCRDASPLGAISAPHISKVRGSLISGPVKEAAIGRRTPGSTVTS